MGAAGGEYTALGGIDRAWDIALQQNPLSLFPDLGDGNRRKQGLSIGMLGILENIATRGRFYDLSQIHYCYTVAHMLHHTEVVADKHIGKTQACL